MCHADEQVSDGKDHMSQACSMQVPLSRAKTGDDCEVDGAPTCIEGPPGPPDEGQGALVKDRVQYVRGVPVGVCPEHGLPEWSLGPLQSIAASTQT